MKTGGAERIGLEQRLRQARQFFEEREAQRTPSPIRTKQWDEWTEDPENRLLYGQYLTTYTRLQSLPWPTSPTDAELAVDPTDLDDLGGLGKLTRWSVNAKSAVGQLCRREVALAASVCLLTVLGYRFLSPHPRMLPLRSERTLVGQTYATRPGEQREIVLPDGSVATLRGESVLRAKLAGQPRIVILDRGDVFVRVRHDPANTPFRVLAGDGSITAHGTRFFVRHDSQHVEVVVTEGSVDIRTRPNQTQEVAQEGQHADERRSALALQSGVPVRVAQGQVISYGVNGRISELRSAKPDQVREPAQGLFIYRKRPLREVVEDIQSYASRPIAIDPMVADCLYSGSVDKNLLDEWLKALPRTFGVGVEEQPHSILILPAHRATRSTTASDSVEPGACRPTPTPTASGNGQPEGQSDSAALPEVVIKAYSGARRSSGSPPDRLVSLEPDWRK
jgi:ferric-dicitrate binding protein FerR (iron transport regulator)